MNSGLGMMKINFIGMIVFSLFVRNLFAAETVPGSTVTLSQCYEWAKEQSRDLKVWQENMEQSQAKARAALGGALPDVKWDFSESLQDPSGVDRLESKGYSGFVKKNQTDSTLSVRQPIYSGFKDFSARSGYLRQRAANALKLERARREIYATVAQSFYTVLQYQTEWSNAAAALVLAQDRVKELNSFLRIGKSRESELFVAQARISALKARMQRIAAQEHSAREELSYLTALDLSACSLSDQVLLPPPVQGQGVLLERARLRTDLKALKEEAAAGQYRIRYERGFFWPTVGVLGRYYTQRATFLEDVKWDASLNFTLPIYQGGTVQANIREAESAHRQTLAELADLERRIFHRVRDLSERLSSALSEIVSLEEAAETARKSYDALRKEYRLGLVTNLDVLQALDLFQEQESARDNARLNAKLLYIQLSVAAETLP